MVRNIVIILGVFFYASHAYAQLSITEIMYDLPGTDTGREWIEVYNAGQNPVDLTKIKLFEAGVNHSITSSNSGTMLSASTYAVIADNPVKFLEDYPEYMGPLFDSVFSLANTGGELLELREASGTVFDSITYNPELGGAGDGFSLQKIHDIWLAAVPTPGRENIIIDTSANDTENTGVSGTSVYSSDVPVSSSNPASVSLSFDISAGRDRIAYVGSPVEFIAGYKAIKDIEPQFSWSYGDGLSGTGDRVYHTYKYEGEYIVVVNGVRGTSKGVARTKVRVFAPKVSFSVLQNGDIEITNIGSLELNLGGWEVRNGYRRFFIPTDTIVAPTRKIRIASSDARLGEAGEFGFMLADPSGAEIARAGTAIAIIATSTQEPVSMTPAPLAYIAPVEVAKPAVGPTATITPTEEKTQQTATALEAGNGSTIMKIISFPWKAMKGFFALFYDVRE